MTGLVDGVSRALSMRATWLEPAPVRGFLDVQRARDFAAFRDGFGAWPGPSLNVVYADAGGHVGWQVVGTLPRRRVGNGIVPLPAWEAGWEPEHLAFDDLPRTLDPPAGFVASANNAPRVDAPDAPFLGVDWLDGYRAARIVEVLEGRSDWDVAGSMALQNDRVSLPWRDLRDVVLAAADGPMADLLREWDGVVAADSVAASVYELLVAELACAMARAEAPNGWRWAVGGGFGRVVPRTSFGARTLSHLVGRLRSGVGAELIPPALARAGEIAARAPRGRSRGLGLGRDPAAAARSIRSACAGRWTASSTWVRCRSAATRTRRRRPGVHPLDPLANPGAIANHRTVIDLGDPERSRFVLAGGQSGNPLSPHYADLFELWRRGEGVPIAWSAEAVDAGEHRPAGAASRLTWIGRTDRCSTNWLNMADTLGTPVGGAG